MKKYRVTYDYEAITTYAAIVEANSEEEAMRKVEDGDYNSEEEVNYQGIEIRTKDVERMY